MEQMMDKCSQKSLSSDNVSAEYEVVAIEHDSQQPQKKDPDLQIAGNGNEEDLKNFIAEGMDSPAEESEPAGQQSSEGCILFHSVSYLGCASVNAPRSETEALKTIKVLSSQQAASFEEETVKNISIQVILSIPNRADGVVRLLDPNGGGEIASFKVYKILFCVRGLDTQPERDCFAFTESHPSSDIFQCHVFRCDMADAVKKVLLSFDHAFRSIPKIQTSADISQRFDNTLDHQLQAGALISSSNRNDGHDISFNQDLFCFNVSLEVREIDGKGGYTTVPWDKASSCFKLRKNLHKQVVMSVVQTSNVQLTIERCFGLLLAPGRNVQHSDMHLLDMEGMQIDVSKAELATNHPRHSHIITGSWDPCHPHFLLLNEETQKGTRVFLSVAVDLVIQEIREPVRLLLEAKARVFPQNDKFWYFGKKVLEEVFYITLRETEDANLSGKQFHIVGLETKTSRGRRLAEDTISGATMLSSRSRKDEEDDDAGNLYGQMSAQTQDTDTDEPLLSGSGEVSHECAEHILTDWGQVLNQWRSDFTSRPAGLKGLVRKGIPNALRGEVWQLLSGCYNVDGLLEKYRILIAKESPQENIIQRDIHRTFPAHDFFKEAGGLGQESLHKISKAYSLYDAEVGYCQGLSFLAAALLLHMPEEQAFGVLCKIMFDYKMRGLFKNGFETLHIKFYQLERAVEDLMPDLHDHFQQLSIEAHMYSSQWFLTLFTAKFPLSMVYRVIDLFLSEGELVIFKVALSLLKCCRRDLLTLDFEGVLKYFRVSLPKKYRYEENTSQLMDTATSIKITSKRLNKYEKEYTTQQELLGSKDPHIIIERDNGRLMEANMRLEAENDDLAQELVTTKITLQTQLEKTMKHAEVLQRDLTAAVEELRATRDKIEEFSNENQRLVEETIQAKELCRREMERQEEDIKKKNSIIHDYKAITSHLSLRIEKMQHQHKEELAEALAARTSDDISPSIVEVRLAAEDEKENYRRQVRNLELELAQTKLSKVESECKVQDLEHQLATAYKELQSSKSTWLHKTINTLTSSRGDKKESTSTRLQSPPVTPSTGSSSTVTLN